MSTYWSHIVLIAMLLASAVVPVCALVIQPAKLNEPLDRVFMGQPAVWAFGAGIGWLGLGMASGSAYPFCCVLTYHILYSTAALFVLSSVNLRRTLISAWVTVYAALGALLLFLGTDFSQAGMGVNKTVALVWAVFTFMTVSLVLIAILIQLYKDRHAITALVALAAWWGWSLVVTDLYTLVTVSFKNVALSPDIFNVSHTVFGVYLVALWLLLTGRVKWMKLSYEPLHVEATYYSSLSGAPLQFDALSSHAHAQEVAMAAVVDERKRIAQDIHDGVGSQLVGLIASLNPDLPAHRRIMLGLESCLLDLKNMVDNVEGNEDDDTNIFDALGRLRYRFSPSLSRAGIRMVWKVDAAGPLIAVRPSQLVHVVRIAQEALANVLVHSQAKVVQLKCCYEAQPTACMLLEIWDNGQGLVKRQPDELLGRGLSGMKERAQRIGAQLSIGTKRGLGTRVRLYLPLT